MDVLGKVFPNQKHWTIRVLALTWIRSRLGIWSSVHDLKHPDSGAVQCSYMMSTPLPNVEGLNDTLFGSQAVACQRTSSSALCSVPRCQVR